MICNTIGQEARNVTKLPIYQVNCTSSALKALQGHALDEGQASFQPHQRREYGGAHAIDHCTKALVASMLQEFSSFAEVLHVPFNTPLDNIASFESELAAINQVLKSLVQYF